MKSTEDKKHIALIHETSSGVFIGIVPGVPGAMSFAETEERLIERLKDAAKCVAEAEIRESEIIDSADHVFFQRFTDLGEPSEHSIEC